MIKVIKVNVRTEGSRFDLSPTVQRWVCGRVCVCVTRFHKADGGQNRHADSDLSQHLAAGPDGSHSELSWDYWRESAGVSRF